MRKLLYGVLCLAIVASLGCCITDYPPIYDQRGDYNGLIRTGHNAYVEPTSDVATIWSDGSDNLITYVYQNMRGDQKLFCKNNFDFSASVYFLDQTYCDWRYQDCAIAEAWNPIQDNIDDIFDYEGEFNNQGWPDCSGNRSFKVLVSQGSRLGECGDLFWADKQNLFAEFANLATTTWRGGNAYIIPVNSSNTSVTLSAGNVSGTMPIYGQYYGFLNESLQLVVPVTANAKHQLNWLRNWTNLNGTQFDAHISYGSLNVVIPTKVAPGGLQYSLGRF
jgi:hypothetical protein